MVSKPLTKVSAAKAARPRLVTSAECWLGGGALAVGRQALDEAVDAHRATDGKALGNIASHLDQQVENVTMLHALCNDAAAKRMGEADGRLDHQAIAAVVGHAFDKALVDLDLVRRDFL